MVKIAAHSVVRDEATRRRWRGFEQCIRKHWRLLSRLRGRLPRQCASH